jgi:Tfp pilus assembly protein PilF
MFDKAEEFFTTALAYNPRAHRSLKHRAEVHLRQDKLSSAREDIEDALELHSASPDYRKLHRKILDAIEQQTRAPASQPVSQPGQAE